MDEKMKERWAHLRRGDVWEMWLRVNERADDGGDK